MAEVISDLELARELVKFAGWQQAAKLLGYCVVAALTGVTPEDLDSRPERTTGWRVRKDLKAFGDHLRAQGWDIGEVRPEDLARVRLEK